MSKIFPTFYFIKIIFSKDKGKLNFNKLRKKLLQPSLIQSLGIEDHLY